MVSRFFACRSISLFWFCALAMSGSWAQDARWLEGWNDSLRSRVSYLADQGLWQAPVSVWPLPWQNEVSLLEENCSSVAHHIDALCRRLKLQAEADSKEASASVSLGISSQPLIFHSFDQAPHEKAFVGVDSFLATDQWQFHGAIVSYADAEDDEALRFDGSYLSRLVGNWSLIFGALPQWWGPNRDQSLILSRNARAFPAVYFARNHWAPFDGSFLRRLGSWHFITFMGQLDDDPRYVEDPLVWGARLTIKPFPFLELGASRAAMWGGDGRKKTPKIFLDLLLGQDNYEGDRVNEPGNQLGGFDFRVSGRLGMCSRSVYGQWIGEDEAGFLPSRPVGAVGASIACPYRSGLWDYFVEWSDTALDFYRANKFYGSAYQHGIYQTGYQYHGRVLGSSFDNDARAVVLGLLWQSLNSPYSASLKLRQIDLNRDNIAIADVTNTVAANALRLNQLEAMAQIQKGAHSAEAGFSAIDEVPVNQMQIDARFTAWLGYRFSFNAE